MSNPGARARAVAAEIVDAVVTHGNSLDAAIARHENRVAAGERPLVRMLCYGALRQHWQLHGWVRRLLTKPLKRRDSVINALLAIGLLQLTDTRIPDHAAVSQTVEAARQLRRPKLAGLVNACMRRFQRDGMADEKSDDDEVRWNHPRWLIEAIREDWPQHWQSVLTANNERAPMWLRVNSSRGSIADYLQRLAAGDKSGVALNAVPGAVRLTEAVGVDELPGFAEGDVSVQDAAAQLAAILLLGGAKRRRVLDACAAPGGKTGHLLELGGDALEVVALDSDGARLDSIRGNLARLGRNATIIEADASIPEEWWDGTPFDAILLDAPCSASGVIRRHPDIKLLRRPGDIVKLQRLQRALLDALWPLLAAGGRFVYATCSVLAAENDDVVAAFLDEHPDALEVDVLPNNNIRDLMSRKPCGHQILPGTEQLDGFYYACLEKVS
ncbi:MAG: 16S rRNA (cytosine(967)-C(5))-methyltransferase RsmB [Gammaproteobacteria bacterium]|nr:16S rRNA (cytosine(967)-C(5))-methyltransferase RsmB [Gammaproteobacteria bacterium]